MNALALCIKIHINIYRGTYICITLQCSDVSILGEIDSTYEYQKAINLIFENHVIEYLCTDIITTMYSRYVYCCDSIYVIDNYNDIIVVSDCCSYTSLR